MTKPDLVLIATSTGGPEALVEIIPKLNKNLGVPVVVVQHTLEGYSSKLAVRLDSISPINVVETIEHEKLEPGKVYIAKAGVHLKLFDKPSTIFPKIVFSNEDKVNYVKPAADVLFKNVASNVRKQNVLVVVGTGMGKDGMLGLEELKKKCNCYCITEREADCRVYGMPKAVYEAGLSDEVANLNFLATRINTLCKEG
ncbi:MAG: CheB methylesterase domain-containing protein [Clostridia bacterium]|nr:CheB methylesterase domain-containing protein [Clostridia bacterium]